MGKSDGDNLVVAVRVRPYNEREKARKAQLIIEMPDNKTTAIRDPNNPSDVKYFTFDYSYWSHSGFTKKSDGYLSGQDEKYADQRRVFDDLGQGVLNNAWAGYNCSLFAYGQTGSGKSYSIVGFKGNKGIVPIVCEELFKRIESNKENNKKNAQYEVFISMFEIYCEKIRDLLSSKEPPKGGLKIREHPKTGFYVEGLSSSPVNSYEEIEAKIEEGTKNRTIAATNMNATSSRAHTIVKLLFNQKLPKSGGGTTTKKSEINLVDLAGSERQRDAGSEGDRLKEGIVINQSLSTLGRVIKALHEQQSNKGKKKIQIPYRDSALTCLLKNALGGNSKTIMIAAISPADINYEESLSTLRFADRAKSIKTNAVVNENQTDRMIRELKEENARLQDAMKGSSGSSNNEELESLRRQLEQNIREMAELEKTWQQKIAEEAAKNNTSAERAAIAKRKQTTPYFWNLNEDPALTDVIVHFISEGEVTIGNKNAVPAPSIQLNGLSILPQHAIVSNKKNSKITVKPLEMADILVNGRKIQSEQELNQNDRIMFGGNHLYVFHNPSKKGANHDITYELAQKEITQHSGIALVGSDGRNKADLILEEELVSTMPLVYRANAMAKEMKRHVSFEIVLVSAQMRGLEDGLTEIWIKVQNHLDDTQFLWEKSRFINRYYGMQEMYEFMVDGEEWNVEKERDPFYEPPDSLAFIGSSVVFLQSLAYLIDSQESFPIVDFSGIEMGQLTVSLTPCSISGREIQGEYVDNPEMLVGKNYGFQVTIVAAFGLPRRIVRSKCRYRFFGAKEIETVSASSNNPSYAHRQLFPFKPVTKQLVDYLKHSNLYITVWGSQRAKNRSSASSTPLSKTSIPSNGNVKKVRRLVSEVKNSKGKAVSVKALETVLDEASPDPIRKEKPTKKKPKDSATTKPSRDRSSSKKGERKVKKKTEK
ncbi:unnamed protein product [Auanema sp. JU1783]|nr:unnamed protein product [Auanema sp. JU1783]